MPISVQVKAYSPKTQVVDCPYHDQPQEVVESNIDITKEQAFEDILTWEHPLISLSLRYSGVPVPLWYNSTSYPYPSLGWGHCIRYFHLSYRVCARRRLPPLHHFLILHRLILLLNNFTSPPLLPGHYYCQQVLVCRQWSLVLAHRAT